jgi:hypothetical protein
MRLRPDTHEFKASPWPLLTAGLGQVPKGPGGGWGVSVYGWLLLSRCRVVLMQWAACRGSSRDWWSLHGGLDSGFQIRVGHFQMV